MPNYSVEGKGRDTGRKRKRIYSAANELEVKRFAEEDGTLVESISELPPEPPTERQLEYARDLGINVPSDATKATISDLISMKVEKDKPSTARHRAFAEQHGVDVTEYVGKKALFDRIHASLSAPGREKELLAWFAFRVYRELTHGAEDAPIDDPANPVFISIADELLFDEKIIKSVRRYRGRDLIWFGEWTAPDGGLHTVGSNRTTAYRQVASLLRERVPSLEPSGRQKPKKSASSSIRKDPERASGCLSLVAIVVLLPLGVVAIAFFF